MESLFGEVIGGLADFQDDGQWVLFGGEALVHWPQGEPEDKAAGLRNIFHTHFHIPVPALTAKPVRLTLDAASLAFFQGVPLPPAGVPRDGSRIGFKYVFYPESVLAADNGVEAMAPIAFFLVAAAPAGLTDADLQPAPAAPAEQEQIQSARRGFREFHAAMQMIREGQKEPGLALLEQAAHCGYCQAQYQLGVHQYRMKTAAAQARARDCFRQAAAQGLREAEYRLGEMLQEGTGGPANLEQARGHYQRAANQGLAEAENAYAIMLLLGEGGPADPAQARVNALRAEAQGVPEAMQLVTLHDHLELEPVPPPPAAHDQLPAQEGQR